MRAGVVSFGEIAPIPWFGTETMGEADETCRKLGDRISDTALDQVPKKMGAVRFALAAALSRPGVVVGAPRVPVTALLPAGKAALAALPARLEAGSLSFKWKVGVESPDLELGLLDELFEVLPAYAKLRLDANGAWDRRQAERWLTRCADRPVEFVEQPVAPAEEETLHGLAEDYPVKLALDESVTGLDEARRWQAEGWSGIFVIKPALAGPLEEVGAWVVATNADVVLSSAIETALGRAAIFRFALQHHAALLQRSPGFGIGEVFGDRLWDGPMLGPVLDESWIKAVNPEGTMERAELSEALRAWRSREQETGSKEPILISEPEPAKFMAAFARAVAAEAEVFLCDPNWGEQEEEQVELLLQKRVAASSQPFPSAHGWLMIPTGGNDRPDEIHPPRPGHPCGGGEGVRAAFLARAGECDRGAALVSCQRAHGLAALRVDGRRVPAF
ncbi:MAG: o-succinylbenzoate synthase [Lacunisphaera sp.]